MRPGLDPFAVVTDVGSVKTSVVTALEPILADSARWVGSHPMAGSERTGLEAARADLFQGAACIVTPTSGTDPEAQRVAVEFWTALGCRVRCMSPQEHDRLVGQVSHLTHLAVAALATVPEAQARELAGGGFRDSTRIAASAVEMWTEILMNNRQAVEAPLGQLIATLEKARAALAKGDEKVLQELLRQANHVRNSL
jgi:prephenate dehydrogenase